MRKPILHLLGLLCLLPMLGARAPKATPSNLCDIYGYIYLETGDRRADYKFYVEESEFSADLVVFQEENPLYADASGHWFITDRREEADYILKQVPRESGSDFIIFYTEYEYRAGCP